MNTNRPYEADLSCSMTCIDADLVRQCQRQEQGWDGILAERLKAEESWILRHCYCRLGTQHYAENATQEVLFRAFRGIMRFQGRSSLRSWISRIADNYCNSLYRKKARSRLTDAQRYSLELIETERASDPPVFAARQSVRKILRAMAKKNQDVLYQRFFQELSLEDLSHYLGLTLSGTKMRLYRAMDRFKQDYDS